MRLLLAATALWVAAFSSRGPEILAAAQSSGGAASSPPPPRSQYQIRWIPDQNAPNRVAAVVSGIDAGTLSRLQSANWTAAEWRNLFSIFAEPKKAAPAADLPAMLGSYRVQSAELWFVPQFPFEPRVKYRAEFRSGDLPGHVQGPRMTASSTFELPSRSTEPVTTISQVYPTSPVIPENLLKFYLHFSAPMSRGHIYDYVHLRDEAGKNVDLPFLEIGEELWDASMTRLTLFIDPGRIKRGVKPLEEIGPSLTAGRRYTLVVDRAWQDANGLPLKAGFERAYQVSPPDRESIDPANWKIKVPGGETREALTLAFPKPMDHALAERVIQVSDSDGNVIEGKTVMKDSERLWVFSPEAPWKRQSYRVVIQLTLEDLAGNNIGKPFEVDLFNGVQRRLTGSSVKLDFRIQ